jgi:2-polyprenyl-3-methyl-5-hydroxy-6-metoxy-1,4-benzoquinol methylase
MNRLIDPSGNCPVCGGLDFDALYPNYEGRCITSDYAVLRRAVIANRCCKLCGLIYNAAGTRGFTEDFYKSSYSLMLRAESAAVQSFSGAVQVTQGERSFNIFREMINPADGGQVLEVGAGKGDFLACLSQSMPKWSITAIEPSASFRTLNSRLPRAKTMRGEFTDFDSFDVQFDAVVALGVLEHVVNPLDMLKWGNKHLKVGGVFFIRVPNFSNNPNDLFCADHLSKLTLPTLRALGLSAGFEVLSEREDGVPVYIALRKLGVEKIEPTQNAYAENTVVALRNVAIARQSLEAVATCRAQAAAKGERFGIFGLGSSGLFAPFFYNFVASEIEAYVDENRTVWGSEIHGRPVRGLDVIAERGIKHIALATSPVYVEKIRSKLTPLGVEVYAAVGS